MPATEAPPAPPPTATSPAPAPAKAPAPALNPMERAFQRMDESAVEADLSAPDPMKTVKEKPKPAPAPKKDEPPKPTPSQPEGDEFEGAPPAPKDKATDTPPLKPEDEALTEAELKAEKPPQQAGPWKLKKYWEKRAAAVEQELAEARKRVAEAEKSGDALKRAAEIEKRNAELEKEIRYANYIKSQEYQEKHEKPWVDEWKRAFATVTQLEVTQEDGTVRKATEQDLLNLFRMPVGQQDALAEQWFGKSSHRVIRVLEKFQELADAQRRDQEQVLKEGNERTEKMSSMQQAIAREITELYTKTNSDIASRLEILKSREGDDEWNSKLDAAVKLADEAFSRNAADPSLTPEQRADIVKKHVAMRNRAIAYSPLMLEVKRLRAQLKERDDKLAKFEQSAPNGGNGGKGPDAKPPQPTHPMERAFRRLEESSVPVPGRFY